LIERYKHAVLSNAFRGILTKDDPAKWKTTTLGEVLAAIEAGKNIRCEERPPRAGERGIVKISSVTWGEFDPSASKTAAPSAILDGKTLIQSGDFLISRANTLELVGACVVVDTLDTQNLYLSDKVLRLRFKQPIEKWVMYFLRSEDGRQQIQELATGNQRSMRNISQSTLRTIRLPLPPREIRERILVAVEKALSAITVTSAESKRAADLLDRLEQVTLTKAFRGELFNVHQMTTAETAAS
jgi:type I restriction enzyme S subunit